MSRRSRTFAEIVTRLETIVADMEKGDLPIEEALERYRTGIELVRQGNAVLDAVEQEIRRIGDRGEETPFIPGEG